MIIRKSILQTLLESHILFTYLKLTHCEASSLLCLSMTLCAYDIECAIDVASLLCTLCLELAMLDS